MNFYKKTVSKNKNTSSFGKKINTLAPKPPSTKFQQMIIPLNFNPQSQRRRGVIFKSPPTRDSSRIALGVTAPLRRAHFSLGSTPRCHSSTYYTFPFDPLPKGPLSLTLVYLPILPHSRASLDKTNGSSSHWAKTFLPIHSTTSLLLSSRVNRRPQRTFSCCIYGHFFSHFRAPAGQDELAIVENCPRFV